jgi:hypothetical protein
MFNVNYNSTVVILVTQTVHFAVTNNTLFPIHTTFTRVTIIIDRHMQVSNYTIALAEQFVSRLTMSI